MEKEIVIDGMMCAHCQKHVTEALLAMDGVKAVTVSLENKTAHLSLEHDIATSEFERVISDAGYTLVK